MTRHLLQLLIAALAALLTVAHAVWTDRRPAAGRSTDRRTLGRPVRPVHSPSHHLVGLRG
jgi:hypothetical protein